MTDTPPEAVSLGGVLDTPFSLSRGGAWKLTCIWTLALVAVAVVLVVLVAVAKAVLGGAPGMLGVGHPAGLILGNSCAAALALAYALRQTRSRPSELLALRPPSPPIAAFTLIGLIGFLPVVSELENVLNSLLPRPAFFRQFFSNIGDLATHPWSGPLALVVMAPVTEELFFRGVILRRLLASMPAWAAIWTSALTFMAMHLNPWQFPVALTAGLLVGWFYARTRSLALCLGVHAFINANSLLLSGLPFTIRGFNQPHPPGQTLFQPWWFTLGGILVLATGLYLFARATPPLPPPPQPVPLPPVLPLATPPETPPPAATLA